MVKTQECNEGKLGRAGQYNPVYHSGPNESGSRLLRNGGLKIYREYKAYLGKFTTVLNYLVDNKHLNKKQDASLLFLSAFSEDSQKNIKRTLFSHNKLPKGKDGSNKPPLWKDIIKAADTEIQVEEEGYFNVTSFSESSQIMQKGLEKQKGNGQQQELMLQEAPTGKVVEKKVADLVQEMACKRFF